MPIYEYKCAKCGVFEATQRITEAPLKKCPTCKGKVERLVSLTSFVLKGSGWYATDYARSGSSAKSDTASTESKSNGTGSESASTPASSASSSDSKAGASDSKAASATKSSAKAKSSAAKSTD